MTEQYLNPSYAEFNANLATAFWDILPAKDDLPGLVMTFTVCELEAMAQSKFRGRFPN